MSRNIPTQWDDIEAWLITTLTPLMAPVVVRNVKPKQTAPYKALVVGADLQGRVTPISRYCRVRLQGWSVRADGTTDLADARTIAAAAGAHLEALPRASSPLIHAEVDAGPYRVTDPISGLEYQYVTVLCEVRAA